MSKKRSSIVANLLGLIFVFFAMASAALVRDGRLLGHEPGSASASADSILVENPDGSLSIFTTDLGKEIAGYSGPVPVEIKIKDETVVSVVPLPNSETPGFFSRVTDSGIIDRWLGLTPEEALQTPVDAVTGATYSSTALIGNVRAGLAYYTENGVKVSAPAAKHGVAFYAALAVVLMASVIPLFVKNKRYRLVQQLLNVGVLGFWTGTFVDYTAMLGLVSGGFGASATIITLAMLAVAFIYPLFGKKGYYCAWVCPLGSLQELAGRCNSRRKLRIAPKVEKALRRFRVVLWTALMLCLWTGWFASWIDYELFTAFMVEEAAVGVTIAGGVFVVLSFFVMRPYCRFVCPTGCLFHLSENLDNK